MRNGGIDKIPLSADVDEAGQFVMRGSVLSVSEAGFKFDLGVLFAEVVVCDDVQTQPFGFSAPLHQFGGIEECLLRRNGGGDDVVDKVQHIRAVPRTHEGFGGGRQDMAQMKRSAAAGIACA